MNPYLIAVIVFTVILCVAWVWVNLKNNTVYLPNMAETSTEDIETRKKSAEKIRSRNFVFGIGGTFALCIATMLAIWLSGPVKKVYAVFNPTATATLTNTPTITPTRTSTPTPRISPTSKMIGTLQAMSTLTGQPSKTPISFVPSGNGSGSSSVTIIQTQLVIQTRIVYATHIIYVPMTVIVTMTETPTATATGAVTETYTLTSTSTETATPTVTSTSTETPTP